MIQETKTSKRNTMKSEIEIELGADDPLSKSTARLSICQADMEEETEGNRIHDYKYGNCCKGKKKVYKGVILQFR